MRVFSCGGPSYGGDIHFEDRQARESAHRQRGCVCKTIIAVTMRLPGVTLMVLPLRISVQAFDPRYFHIPKKGGKEERSEADQLCTFGTP